MGVFSVEKVQKGFVLHLNNSDYFLELKFRQRQLNYDFSVNTYSLVSEKHEHELIIFWNHKSIGKVNQKIFLREDKRHHKSVFDVYVGKVEYEFIPEDNIDGIIECTIGFKPAEIPYFMIPGHIYNTNNIKNSKSIQPQLNYHGDICYPKTPLIYTRSDRSSHNTVLAHNKSHIVGLRINEVSYEHCEIKNSHNKNLDYLYNGLTINTLHYDQMDRIGITIGYQHFPVHYFGKLGKEYSCSAEDEIDYISFAKDVSYTTYGHMYFAQTVDGFAYEDIIQYFYEEIHQYPGILVDRLGAISDISKALIEDAYQKEYHYFPTVISGVNGDAHSGGDMGWTGGMQVVYPLIRASKFVKETLDVAYDFIDHLVLEGFNEKATMFYEAKKEKTWQVSGWWKKHLNLYDENLNRLSEAHSAYVNGQITCYLLKTYQYLVNQKDVLKGKDITSYYNRAKAVIDFVIDHQRYDGAFGVFYNPLNGKPLYYNSFQGVWFLAGTAELYKITRNKVYKDAFYKGFEFYYPFLERLELWGTPMDVGDAVDEEGNLAFIMALKTMHEVTHDKTLLDALVHAFHYEFSWKFAYNTVHVNEPLKSLNWPSCGGSITSSHNIHIHQMGNLVCEEMFYVYEKTKDPYILSRLHDTLNWGLGTHNSEVFNFGFGSRGWASEQFFHTDGKQDDVRRVVDGGIWYDYLSWAAACCLLSTSLDIEDKYYYNLTR